MNTTVLYIVMVCASILMAVLPFGVFMGIGSMVGLPSTDIRMLLAYAVILLAFAYVISLMSFSLIQKSSCGEVKNFKQVALNSLISLGFHLGLLLLVLFVPWFRNIVANLFSPEIDQTLRDSVGFGYYSFWATMFGVALGGTLSGSCATDIQTNLLPLAVLNEQSDVPVAEEAGEQDALLPPE